MAVQAELSGDSKLPAPGGPHMCVSRTVTTYFTLGIRLYYIAKVKGAGNAIKAPDPLNLY